MGSYVCVLCRGQRYTPEGQLEPSSKVLCISVKPGWKKGTKVTYPCEGDEGQGIIPAGRQTQKKRGEGRHCRRWQRTGA